MSQVEVGFGIGFLLGVISTVSFYGFYSLYKDIEQAWRNN